MLILPLSAITIPPDRQRQAFDGGSLEELMESIQTVGLLHPIVLREGCQLVAGERRFRAVQALSLIGVEIRFGGELLPVGHVAAVDLGDLSPKEQYQAELDENIRRADLTWQEKAQALARLSALRQEGGLSPAEAVREIAKDIAPDAERLAAEHLTRQSITLAAHLDDP